LAKDNQLQKLLYIKCEKRVVFLGDDVYII